MGYLKRMAMDKVADKVSGKATLSEAETERREQVMAPMLAGLKQQKEHTNVVSTALQKHCNAGLPAALAIQELANACPNQARTLVSQVCGSVAGLQKLYVMSLNQNVLGPLEEAGEVINAAREAKENYYEQRQVHDRSLASFQGLQGKTEGIKPDKLEKHQAAMTDAKAKWEAATAAYNEAEAALKNAMNLATHKKGEVDKLVLKAVVEAELTEQAGIGESFQPVEAEIAKARDAAEAFAADCADKKQKLCNPSSYPTVGLATAAVEDAQAAAAADEAESVLSPTTPTDADEPDPYEANPMVTAAAAGGAIVDDPASALASGSSAPAGGADLKEVTIQKGPRGFGFSTDDEGVITGAGGPAADAGVPAGSRIVAVAGVAVGSKPEIIAQLRALGSDVVEVQFTLQLSSAFGSAGADGGNVAI
jgi:hypothetical protein|eukprot:COSAG02_NODE_30_length_50867_cov_66.594331_21_plen_422_part_00